MSTTQCLWLSGETKSVTHINSTSGPKHCKEFYFYLINEAEMDNSLALCDDKADDGSVKLCKVNNIKDSFVRNSPSHTKVLHSYINNTYIIQTYSNTSRDTLALPQH